MWGIDEHNKRLTITDADGAVYAPSAVEIFKIVFSRTNAQEGDLYRELKSSYPNLKFKPELSFPTLHISTDANGESKLLVKLHNADSYIDDLSPRDQLVIGNIWFPLEEESFSEVRQTLARGSVQIGEPLDAQKSAWLLWESGLSIEVDANPDAFRGSLLKQTDSAYKAATLSATLYPYQQSGATFIELMLEHGRGVLLADEMGLGKTIQAIYAVTAGVSKGRVKNLIIVPASNLANWRREFSKFSPNLDVQMHVGPRRAGTVNSLNFGEVILTTYDIVYRDNAFLSDVAWDSVILDEAQNIKNAKTRRSQSVVSLSKTSGLAITGTPIENSLSDIWSIFQFLEPTLLGDEYEFSSQYPDTHAAALALSKQISPFVVRRRVNDVAQDLPEKLDFFVPIFLSEEMNSRYEEIRNEPSLKQLPRMQALRQLCAVPSEYLHSSNKVARLMDLLGDAFANKDKAIVFASFTDTIDSIVRCVQSSFPSAFVETLDGRRTPQDRQDIIDKFSALTGAAVLIANPRAAGVGLNIQAANYVFHFNPEWNPALISQASARAFRRGQEKTVFIYYLYYRGTVEEYILKKLEEKQALQSAGLQELLDEPNQSQLLEALRLSPSAIEELRK